MTPVTGIGAPEWNRRIIDGGAAFDLEVTADHCRRFAQHAETLLFWNRKINLTAIVDPAEIAVKHFVDSLAAAGHLPAAGRLLDIGAGGGFPGIPLKVMRPDLGLCMIDKVRKKISFLNHLIATLNLTGATALHARAEDLGVNPQYAGRFDTVICRALTTLADFARLATPLLKSDGYMLAMKGRIAKDELAALEGADELPRLAIRAERYELPATGDRRTLVRMTPVHAPVHAEDSISGMNL